MNINPMTSNFKEEYHVIKFGKSIFKGTKTEVIKKFNKLDRNVKHFCWKAQTTEYHNDFIPMITSGMMNSILKNI